MLCVRGQCYAIREQLKAMGCTWDADLKEWFAPEDVHSQAQALADIENRREWLEYLSTLPWCDGEFTQTVWLSGLRAASLWIAYAEAWQEIATRVRAVKSAPDKWFDRNVGRAYEAGAAEAGSSWKAGEVRPTGRTPEPKKERPTFKNEVLAHVARPALGVDLAWLADRSPIDPCGVRPEDFLFALYSLEERVVVFDVFASQGQWLWSAEEGFVPTSVLPPALYEASAPPREIGGEPFTASGPEGIWYLCNPVSGQWRWMTEGGDDPHWSRRFHECVTSWRYMVIESDKADPREWVALVVQLPLRIAAIYTSGGKSVHVLVRVDAKNKRQWDEWRDEVKEILVTLGADPGCMSAVRLTRLPGCERRGRFDAEGRYHAHSRPKSQKLLWLNPAPDMRPIASRLVLRDALGPWVRLAESLLATDPTEIDPEVLGRCRGALAFYSSVPAMAALRKGVLA